MTDTESTPEQVAALAKVRELVADLANEAPNELAEVKQTATRWVLASFLALNSGGIVTATAQDGGLSRPILISSIFFIGLMASLVAAIWASYAVDKYASRLRTVSQKAQDLPDVPTAADVRAIADDVVQAGWVFTGPVLAGIASGILFVSGCATYVAFQKGPDLANAKRCLAVQRDMLSAHPRRSDGPDLFSALGCHPDGAGSVFAPPTNRERQAGKPLPWGGYPPPTE